MLTSKNGAPPLLECAAPAEQFTKAAYEAAMDAHDPERRCTVLLWGVTEAGVSVHAEISGWCPWLRVQVPDSWSDTDSGALRAKFSALGIDGVAMGITKERLKQLCGWEPDPSNPAAHAAPELLEAQLCEPGRVPPCRAGAQRRQDFAASHSYGMALRGHAANAAHALSK
jgi:hypothetical protein